MGDMDKCMTCGHTRRRHPKKGACTAICNCSRFLSSAEAIREAGEQGKMAAYAKVGNYRAEEEQLATTPHEGMKQPLLKCTREGCGHYYGNHPKIDDHAKQQAHWMCIECDCKEFMFNMDKVVTKDEKEPLGSWEHDAVNHPSHYTAYPGIEVIQLTRHMTFNRGNAVKYVARAGLKNKETEVEDLEKAIWYLQDEVKLLKGEHEG